MSASLRSITRWLVFTASSAVGSVVLALQAASDMLPVFYGPHQPRLLAGAGDRQDQLSRLDVIFSVAAALAVFAAIATLALVAAWFHVRKRERRLQQSGFEVIQ